MLLAGLTYRLNKAGASEFLRYYGQKFPNDFPICARVDAAGANGSEDAAVLSIEPPLVFLSSADHRKLLDKTESVFFFQ